MSLSLARTLSQRKGRRHSYPLYVRPQAPICEQAHLSVLFLYSEFYTQNIKEKGEMVTQSKTPRKKSDTTTTIASGSAIDLGNLNACINDARVAALDGDTGPADPTDYSDLMGRLESSRDSLPPLYRQTFFDPYRQTLRDLGREQFVLVLLSDPQRTRTAGLMLDMAHAILQNGEGFEKRATDGFQEVVSDLYDGFLSAEDRVGVKPPDEGVIPPLVKWGNPDSGPYTWPVDATSVFNAEAGVVNLPPANARRGLLAWSALAHETAGHDILHADTGLQQELARKVRENLSDQGALQGDLPRYWSDRIDETASDVMGILNMGPAAGIGLVGYFRGLNAAFTGQAALRNEGLRRDPHPADILRGFLAAAVVRHLSFQAADDWSNVILKETEKDVDQIVTAGQKISPDDAKTSADIVAETIVGERLESLEDHALCEIQDWRDEDETICSQLQPALTHAVDIPLSLEAGTFAAHVVAAAVTAALKQGSDIGVIFDRMLSALKIMHDANPSWGPLFVKHPGDLFRNIAYVKASHD
jgi:hypothetical protein